MGSIKIPELLRLMYFKFSKNNFSKVASGQFCFPQQIAKAVDVIVNKVVLSALTIKIKIEIRQTCFEEESYHSDQQWKVVAEKHGCHLAIWSKNE